MTGIKLKEMSKAQKDGCCLIPLPVAPGIGIRRGKKPFCRLKELRLRDTLSLSFCGGYPERHGQDGHTTWGVASQGTEGYYSGEYFLMYISPE